jgi:hypothetical protein
MSTAQHALGSGCGARAAGVDAHAIDPVAAERLWALSAELTGVTAFG